MWVGYWLKTGGRNSDLHLLLLRVTLNDGVIDLDIVNQTNNYTIIWSNGMAGDSIYNLSAGSYTYAYSDEFGCEVTDSISILEPFAMNVQHQITHAIDSTGGSIQILINGVTPPY